MHDSLQDLKLWLIHEISGSDNEGWLYGLKDYLDQQKRYIYEPTPEQAEKALLMLNWLQNQTFDYQCFMKKNTVFAYKILYKTLIINNLIRFLKNKRKFK